VQSKVETTGAATPVDTAQPASSSATFTSTTQTSQAAKLAPAQTASAAGKCDVAACASAYSSFRASDCTYQPFEGARQVCVKPPAAGQKTAAAPRPPAVDARKRGRDEELREVEREVRRITPRTADIDDDVIYIRRPRW
jgi:hypothetical protein